MTLRSQDKEPAGGSARPETGPEIADAAFIPREEAPRLPRVYAEAPPREERGRDRRLPAGAVLAMCVVCLLLGAGLHALSTAPPAAPAAEPATEAPAVPATLTPAPAVRASATAEAPALSPGELYALACPQVVGVACGGEGSNALGAATENALVGTGCILTADGYVLTSYRPLREAMETGRGLRVLLYDGRELPAELVGYDSGGTDLALLKAEGEGLRVVIPADARTLTVGEPVYVLGNPLGEPTYTLIPGMLSAVDRAVSAPDPETGESRAQTLLQISAALSRGGGPVYNARGQLIGLATERLNASGVEGLGLAVPVDEAMAVAEELMAVGCVRGRPCLGLVVQTVTEAVADYYNQYYEGCMVPGAQVYAIEPDGPSAETDIRRGDIITALDGRAVSSAAALAEAELAYRAGDTATLTVYRGREYLEIDVIFGERPPETEADAPAAW